VEKLSSGINGLGIFFTVVFAVIAFLVAFNTVRLAIYNVKEEIAIMRLVGAANFFIRGPLFVQSALAGFLAVIIVSILFALILWLSADRLAFFLPGLDLFGYFRNNLLTIIILQLVAGVGLGFVSTAIAARKYLMT
jgi:cell division transport system permease protein